MLPSLCYSRFSYFIREEYCYSYSFVEFFRTENKQGQKGRGIATFLSLFENSLML